MLQSQTQFSKKFEPIGNGMANESLSKLRPDAVDHKQNKMKNDGKSCLTDPGSGSRRGIGESQIISMVKGIYAELCSLEIAGEVNDPSHNVVMAKFWRAMKPFYPAEKWKERGLLVEHALRAITKTVFVPRVSAPRSRPPKGYSCRVIPVITVRPLEEEHDGARFTVNCRLCGHLCATITRTRGDVERSTHAREHCEGLHLWTIGKASSHGKCGTKQAKVDSISNRNSSSPLKYPNARRILRMGYVTVRHQFKTIPIHVFLHWLEKCMHDPWEMNEMGFHLKKSPCLTTLGQWRISKINHSTGRAKGCSA